MLCFVHRVLCSTQFPIHSRLVIISFLMDNYGAKLGYKTTHLAQSPYNSQEVRDLMREKGGPYSRRMLAQHFS